MSASASSSSSSSKPSKEGQPTLKVACQRCRSMKYRCPGPSSPNTTQCNKCIKAGVECVVEQHRRGRKLGTRLTDPEKALIRMKSAFDIIQRAKQGNNIEIPSEVAAFFEASSSSAAAAAVSRPLSAASSSSMGSPPDVEPITNAKSKAKRPRPSATSSSNSISPAATATTQSPAPLASSSSSNLHNPTPASTSSLPLPHPSAATTFLPPPPPPIQLTQTPISRLGPACPGPFFSFPPAFQSSHTHSIEPSSNQFDDIGPSSRPSISLASLFSLQEEDPSRSSEGLDKEEAWRQDPIVLGILTEEGSRALFDLFMDKIDPIICYFDRVLYTHDYVREASQLLFATILSIALKFSPHIDPTTRDRVRFLARDQVLKIISDGEEQTVESVQALLLMTEFKERDDRKAYFLLGMACRLAMDLNLGQPLLHLNERRNRNRIRAWLNAFSADRRFAGCGAVGSPSMMSEDWAVRNCLNFHRHPMSSFGDARLAAAIELRKLLGRYDTLIKTNAEHVQGPEKTPLFNLRDLFLAASSELETWSRVWTAEILDHHPKAFPLELHLCEEHGKLQIAHHWLFQVFRFPTLPPWVNSQEDWEAERRAALAACLSGSCRILKLMIATPKEMLSYSPDIEHLFYSYATFFLLKMFKARILEIELFEPASIAFIFDLLRLSVAKLEECALDETHTISLHLKLLKSILTSYPQYALASSFPSTSTNNPPSSPSLDSPSRLRIATAESSKTGGAAGMVEQVESSGGAPGGGAGAGEAAGTGSGAGGVGGGTASSSSVTGEGAAGGGAGSDSGDISVFLGEDWSDLWLEGGMVDEMLGAANTGELDFSFFDFAAPN